MRILQQEKPQAPGQFYAKRWIIYAALGIPRVSIESWRLRATGSVERNLEYTYEQLLREASRKLVRDYHCVTGWSIEKVEWEGIPFRRMAEMASVKPEALYVMFHCVDGYTAVVPLEDAMVEDSIIAVKMNGKALSLEQGFPARPFIPHLYGWKSAKWLNEIEFLPDYQDGYWEAYGYHERGDVKYEERFKGRVGRHLPRRSVGTSAIR